MIHRAEEAPRPLLPPTQRSTIAGVNALFRMKESSRRAPILVDEWARLFAEERLLVQAIRYGRFALPPLSRAVDSLQTAHCVRHRAIDQLILEAVERDGFRQVVVIGAGYDMRPSRFAERIGEVRWYEIDLPETIERKKRLLVRRAVRPYEGAAVDLSKESVLDGLARTSFDSDWSTLFVMEGLIHYLPRPRVDALMQDAATGRGRRRALLSFIRSDVYRAAHSSVVTLMRLLGEGPKLHFSPPELAALCAWHGFGRFRSWSYDEQVAQFAREAEGRAVGSTQDVAFVERD